MKAHAGGCLGCSVHNNIDISASAVYAPAADWLALHHTTGDTQQHSAVHSWGAQLQVTNSVCLGDDVIIIVVTGFNRFLQTGTCFAAVPVLTSVPPTLC